MNLLGGSKIVMDLRSGYIEGNESHESILSLEWFVRWKNL